MKMKLIISLGILIFLLGSIFSTVGLTEESNTNYLKPNGINGVVLIDDIHNNDKAATGNLASLYADLESLGYSPFYTSDFTDLDRSEEHTSELQSH